MATDERAILIRLARDADAEAYRELRLEALRLHPEAFSADHDELAAKTLDHWREKLKPRNPDDEALFFAEDRGALIGMTGIYRGHSRKTRHDGFVWGVYVREAWRGRRLGERLVGACVEWGRARGLRHAKLGVAVANDAAIRCYARCGFTTYGLDPGPIHANGAYHDELLMSLRLTP